MGRSAGDAGHHQPKAAYPRKRRVSQTVYERRWPAEPNSLLPALGLGRWKADERVVMRQAVWASITALMFFASSRTLLRAGDAHSTLRPAFQTSDRCVACHNGMKTKSGEDFSIGIDWRSSIMANSSRDPYWQASVRRETIDHPEAEVDIQDECSHCHMPITFYEAHLRSKKGEVFAHLPFDPKDQGDAQAADGVSCSVCHQISKENLGTRASF